LLVKGIIIKSTGSRYKVLDENNRTVDCSIKGKFRIKGGIRTTNPVAVGDNVMVDYDGDTGSGIITELLDRKNYILRKSINLSKEFQIIAANIDRVLLMVSMVYPETPLEFVDRFLVTAEAYRIPVSIIINKTDLYDETDRDKEEHFKTIYSKIGYDCFSLTLLKESDLSVYIELLKDKISLLSGNSGVGKTSLINKLNPSLNLKTGEVSGYHKQGKHITTFPEMHPLPFGGFLIDSPGIRGFGVADMKREEVYHFFPEIFKKAAKCRYNNCIHIDEPGCAVIEAVENGDIDYSRYRSYFNIVNDDNRKYR
jgi:ribosome biogenesis GTPase